MGPRWLWLLPLAQPQCPWELWVCAAGREHTAQPCSPLRAAWGAHRDPHSGFSCQQGHSGHCGDIPHCPTLPPPAGHHLKTICPFCHISRAPRAPKSAKCPPWSRVDRAGPSPLPAPQPHLGGDTHPCPGHCPFCLGLGGLGHHPGGHTELLESCWLPTGPEGLVGFVSCKRSFEWREGG